MESQFYGKHTGVGVFEELRFINHERKPLFLIKMCERFEEPETRFRLDCSVSYCRWLPGRSIPSDLVSKILGKLSSIDTDATNSDTFNSSKLSNPDGSVYEGYLKDNKRHGKGKYKFADGNV
jgi:hypothetical protein